MQLNASRIQRQPKRPQRMEGLAAHGPWRTAEYPGGLVDAVVVPVAKENDGALARSQAAERVQKGEPIFGAVGVVDAGGQLRKFRSADLTAPSCAPVLADVRPLQGEAAVRGQAVGLMKLAPHEIQLDEQCLYEVVGVMPITAQSIGFPAQSFMVGPSERVERMLAFPSH